MEDLVAAVIHDAKNALLALDTQLSQAAHRPASVDFQATRQAVVRIASQLTELLTLYRAQTGAFRLAIDDHDLADFCEDLRDELGPVPAGIALDINCRIAATLGAWAFDAYLIKLAVLDALRNALRHARSRVALIVSHIPGNGLCIEVSDDGPGFPPEILDGKPGVSGSGSTGLGMSFMRLIAEHHATPNGHHGHVEFTNDSGAKLRIYLP